MNNNGNIKIKKNKHSSKPGNILLLLLIFFLSVSTFITIQIRSAKRDKQIAEQSEKTSVYKYTDNPSDVKDVMASITDESQTKIIEKTETKNIDTDNVIHEEVDAPYDNITKINYIMPANGNLIKGFSKNKLVYSETMNDWRLHLGVDIECNIDSEIKSMADGKIYDIYTDSEYGNIIVIEHEDSTKVRYCNLDINPELTFGSRVEQGKIIGTVTKNPPCEVNDNLHIHVEAFADDIIIDPLSLITN